MRQNIRAFLIALLIPVLFLSGCGAPLNAPIATPSVTDSLTEESFAEPVDEFVSEYGDTAFDELSSQTPALTEAELAQMTEVERLIATIPYEKNLAYDEAYCCRLKSDGSLVLVMGIGQVNTVEKVSYLFPNVEIKERIGDYTLTDVSINSDCYYSALMGVWERDGKQMLPSISTPKDFEAGTFQEGGRYHFALPAPETRLEHITLRYENGEETQIVQMYLYDSAPARLLSEFEDGAVELGSEFARHSVDLVDGEGEYSGYHAAVYAGENAGYAYLLSVRMQDDMMYTVYRDAEEFASLLRAFDLPGMLSGAQKATG